MRFAVVTLVSLAISAQALVVPRQQNCPPGSGACLISPAQDGPSNIERDASDELLLKDRPLVDMRQQNARREELEARQTFCVPSKGGCIPVPIPQDRPIRRDAEQDVSGTNLEARQTFCVPNKGGCIPVPIPQDRPIPRDVERNASDENLEARQ